MISNQYFTSKSIEQVSAEAVRFTVGDKDVSGAYSPADFEK